MGVKWRGQKQHVKPQRDWVPIGAALILLMVASAVHWTLFPLNSEAAETVKFKMFGDLTGDSDVIRIVKIRGENCLDTEDSTKLRLVAYKPSDKTVVYRCVTP
jgi:hypothetical protein